MWRRANEPRAQPRECDVGINLLEADLDMPPADPPPPGDVIGIVVAGQELANPLHERPLEPVDLGLPARDHLASRGMPLDLGVEVVDKIIETRLQERGGRHDPSRRRPRSSPRTTGARDTG